MACEQYTAAVSQRVGDPTAERRIGQDRLLRIQAPNVEHREAITKKCSTVDHWTQLYGTLRDHGELGCVRDDDRHYVRSRLVHLGMHGEPLAVVGIRYVPLDDVASRHAAC